MHVYLLTGLLLGYCNNQLFKWGIWQSGLNMFGRFNCPITGVQLLGRLSDYNSTD